MDPLPKYKRTKPATNIFKTEEFLEELKKAHAQNGSFIFDPRIEKNTGAYFQRITGKSKFFDDSNWIIAFRKNSNMSIMIHELTHKMDHIDDLDKGLEKLLLGKSNFYKSERGKKLYEWGENLVKSYYSEINATNAQFKFYMETRSFPILDFLNTVVYQGQNRMKVELGRIIISPNDPKRYALLLYGSVQYLLPLLPIYATTAGVYGYGLYVILSDLSDE